jgi:hypothetical protein
LVRRLEGLLAMRRVDKKSHSCRNTSGLSLLSLARLIDQSRFLVGLRSGPIRTPQSSTSRTAWRDSPACASHKSGLSLPEEARG